MNSKRGFIILFTLGLLCVVINAIVYLLYKDEGISMFQIIAGVIIGVFLMITNWNKIKSSKDS